MFIAHVTEWQDSQKDIWGIVSLPLFNLNSSNFILCPDLNLYSYTQVINLKPLSSTLESSLAGTV
jgi:hypothetical protein